jgi:hypothetical protein
VHNRDVKQHDQNIYKFYFYPSGQKKKLRGAGSKPSPLSLFNFAMLMPASAEINYDKIKRVK